MLPVTYDLKIYQGDTYRLPLVLRRNDGTSEDPVWVERDLSGHEGLAQIRNPRGGDLIASFDVEIDTEEQGKVTLVLEASESRKLTRNAVWDFQTTSDELGVRTWVRGDVEVHTDVSRQEQSDA